MTASAPPRPEPPPALTDPERRGWMQQAGSLVLLLGAADIVRGANLVAVRVWPAADYTRVTIESDQALVTSHFAIDQPPRLAIDIDELELSPRLRELVAKVGADDPHIARVRVGQSEPRKVRMVFDLKSPSQPQVFTLAPIAPYRHRLVFDLYPSKAPDPLLKLVREREVAMASGHGTEESSARAAAEVDDALGQLIGRIDKPGTTAPGEPRPAKGSPNNTGTEPPTGTATAPKPGGVAGGAPGNVTGSGAVKPADGSASAPARGAVSAAASGSPTPPTSPPAVTPPATPPATARVQPGRAGINRLVIVAIDPGHGGEDPGALGPSGLREKDIVLQIAEQLQSLINDRPGMRAMLTRDADFFVPLQDRVRKAQRVQADLFVSIHADAFITPQARGASVFALSERSASSATARWMAQRENRADAIGGINIKAQDQHVMRTLFDMSTSAQIRDSLRVAREVLGHIGQVGKLHSGEVEQAGFAVLKAPDIPSILVETGFISNPEEESRLRSPAYQAKLVRALYTGIVRYFARNPPLARNRML